MSSVATPRLQALLAYLVLHEGEEVSRQHVSFLFWPDSAEGQARTNLRQLLHHLRSALPEADKFLDAEAQLLRWHCGSECHVDIRCFRAALARAAKASSNNAENQELEALEEAVRFYRGDLLPGSYEDWIEEERQRLKREYIDALRRLSVLVERRNGAALAVVHAERLVAADPLSEYGYQTLIRLHSANGDRAAALRVYHQCVTVLRRELGLEPGPETRELRDQVTAKKPEPAPRQNVRMSQNPAGGLPLVGREQILDQLAACWSAARGTPPYFVLLAGEPGIGKTRLMEELCLRAVREDGATVANAACYAAGGQLAYAPVAEWLRAPAMQAAISSLSAAQLREVSRLIPQILDRRPEVGTPQPFVDDWQRHHFYEALARAILCARQPLLLTIDDTQWCDWGTGEWLRYLMQFDLGAKLLIVATARSEEIPPGHPVSGLLRELARAGRAREIDVEPLSEEATHRLAALASQRTSLPDDLSGLYRQTRGNPLFVIEGVRAGLSSSATAPKVQMVLSARLAQLSTSAQEIAGAAATIGRPFTLDLLADISNRSPDSLVEALDELWQKRVLVTQADGSYDFSHDELRDVAYSQLGPARRSILHRRAAAANGRLRPSDPDSVAAEIASHLERAGQASEAIPLYHRAAVAVQRRYADAEAIGLLRRALSLLGSIEDPHQRDVTELRLLSSLGPSLDATLGYASPEVGAVYNRARMLCEYLGDEGQQLRILIGSWTHYAVCADLAAALQVGERYLELARRTQDPELIAAGDFGVGCTLSHFGEFQKAGAHLGRATDHYDRGGRTLTAVGLGADPAVFCRAYSTHVLWHTGHADRSLVASNVSIDLARELAHPFSLALAMIYRALLHKFRDEPDEADESAAHAAELCARHGFPYYHSWAPIIRGWATARRGQTATGLEMMSEGYQAFRATGAALRAPYYLGMIASAQAQLGKYQDAASTLAEAFAFAARTGEAWPKPELEWIRGDIQLQQGDRIEALANYRAAVRSAKRLGIVPVERVAQKKLSQLIDS